MRTPRIYCKTLSSADDTIRLEGQAVDHITKVLRLKSGNQVQLFNSNNLQCISYISHINKYMVELTIDSCETVSRESPVPVTLIQGVSRGERMDWVLQKATELGVHRIIPTFMSRTIVKLDDKKIALRLKHWSGVITHACEQCGRNQLPILENPADDLEQAIGLDHSELRFALDPAGTTRLRDTKRTPNNICLIVGPEGGFDSKERLLMSQSGIQGLVFGPRILRTETAGIAALAAIGAVWGDL